MIGCPKCKGATYVLETRSSEDGSLRRRRGCVEPTCDGRVTTVEVIAPVAKTKAQTTRLVALPRSAIDALRDLIQAFDAPDNTEIR